MGLSKQSNEQSNLQSNSFSIVQKPFINIGLIRHGLHIFIILTFLTSVVTQKNILILVITNLNVVYGWVRQILFFLWAIGLLVLLFLYIFG